VINLVIIYIIFNKDFAYNIEFFNYKSLRSYKLYLTWTDFQIEELCKKLNMTMSFTSEFPTRKSYIFDIAAKIQRFKANPQNAELWRRQVIES
jgi:hypothetical protein